MLESNSAERTLSQITHALLSIASLALYRDSNFIELDLSN